MVPKLEGWGGLPDRIKLGTHLVAGFLKSAASVVEVRKALPISRQDGDPPGVAYRDYPGKAVVEYLIPNDDVKVLAPEISDLTSSYGGPTAGCEPSIPPARGCVGE